MKPGRRNIDIYAILFIYLFIYLFYPIVHSRHKALIGNFKSSSVTDYFIFSYIKVAIIFACTKVLQDVAYAYLPLFLIYRVDFGKVSVHMLMCFSSGLTGHHYFVALCLSMQSLWKISMSC